MIRKRKILALIAILSSIILTSCNLENNDKGISSDENVKTTSVGDVQKVRGDEIVSVVDEFYKSRLSLDINNAVSYCTGSYKKEVNKNMKDSVKQQEELSCTILDSCVEWAQELFFKLAKEDDDIIDASYLYDDKDVGLAIKETVTYIISNCMSYSLPEKAEMLSKNKATVTIHTYLKTPVENDISLPEIGKGYLQNKVFEKLIDDTGFIRKAAAKKLMKQLVIENIHDIKKIYEEADETEMGTRIIHLKKKDGKWLISKVEINEKSFDNNSDEDDYYEDDYEDYYEEDDYEDYYYED